MYLDNIRKAHIVLEVLTIGIVTGGRPRVLQALALCWQKRIRVSIGDYMELECAQIISDKVSEAWSLVHRWD